MAPMTRKRKSELEAAAAADTSVVDAPDSVDSQTQKKLPVRAKDGEVSTSAASPSVPAKGNLKVFTDDDDAAESADAVPPVIAKAPAPAPEVEEEDEESDDEAPEAVSTTRVASEAKKSTQAAQKAAQEQAAEKKRKRQQRDVLFKQQAEERKKAQDEAKASAVESSAAEEPPVPVETAGRRRRTDKIKVPDLLPAEFLEDPSSEDEDENSNAVVARAKKRKIADIEKSLASESRGPRDERVGSTVYRVAKKADERMAPKTSKQSKNSKDLLLKRNRTAVAARRR
ncbi:hypothetical protein BGZ63DRAFT_374339 [Mariannaea sp. PMI_226]|nr:hypothetical protein BGZ63DRAFT_374339 [Mariannaea sp. PMI_226]